MTAIRLQYSVKYLEAIYREEGKLAGLSSEERLAQRQLVVKPLVDAFFAYLKQNETKAPKSGKTREAFTYALNQERYLRVFLDDGDVPIDNNASERAIRGFCIGKKKGSRIELSEEGKQALNQQIVSAKYSCGFSNILISSIIVGERYLDYFTTITEDRLWQLLAKPVFRWRNSSGLSMNAAKAV